MRIEHSIDIAAPVERVWELTLDVERWPEMTPTMTSVERLDHGPLAPGSEARIEQPGQRTRVWRVVRVENGADFAWSTRIGHLAVTGCHELTAIEEGTRNTVAIEMEGFGAGLLGRLGRKRALGLLSQENEGFKAAAEMSDVG